jgi:hypothetical protein
MKAKGLIPPPKPELQILRSEHHKPRKARPRQTSGCAPTRAISDRRAAALSETQNEAQTGKNTREFQYSNSRAKQESRGLHSTHDETHCSLRGSGAGTSRIITEVPLMKSLRTARHRQESAESVALSIRGAIAHPSLLTSTMRPASIRLDESTAKAEA